MPVVQSPKDSGNVWGIATPVFGLVRDDSMKENKKEVAAEAVTS